MTNTTIVNNLYPIANGTTSSNPFVDHFALRDPTPNDVNFPIQKKWLNTSIGSFWELQNFITTQGIVTAHWIKIASSLLTESLTGNSGGAVFPDGANNINVIGDTTTINIVGNPAIHTLTASTTGIIATSYVEDSGSAIPSAGVLNVLGGAGITTSGSGNTITISSTETAFAYVSVNHAASPYTVLSTDFFISCDPSGGTITINLPNAPVTNKLYIVKDRTGNASANNISVTTPGGVVTIDGLTTYTITSNYGSINLLFNGTSYEVF